jgi:hypothetical protein
MRELPTTPHFYGMAIAPAAVICRGLVPRGRRVPQEPREGRGESSFSGNWASERLGCVVGEFAISPGVGMPAARYVGRTHRVEARRPG